MVYITVRSLSDTHRTYVYEDDAYLKIDGQFIMAKDIKPNMWWDDEYITETEVKKNEYRTTNRSRLSFSCQMGA